MTIRTWLAQATQTLVNADIPTARLDTLVLLEDITGIGRAQLLAHEEELLADELLITLDRQLERRCNHEPLAYIRGHSEFYGREFIVDHNVLEPRPESETMITLLKSSDLPNLRDTTLSIGDIGTGSGCLGITAALELGLSKVCLHDIDPGALNIARRNAEHYKINAETVQADLLDGRTYDVLLANLPYVPDDFAINTAAGHEPKIALYGGPDGLDLYRRLFAEATGLQRPPLAIYTEALPPQHPELEKIAASHKYVLKRSDDFIQEFTYLS